jgi:ElaA protein
LGVTSMPKIETEWHCFEALTAGELYELLRFRQDIFVVEQRSPYPDLDGLDQRAWHLLLRSDAQLAGYLRLIPTSGRPPVVRIGRFAVSSQLRRRGIGRTLMQQALSFCSEHYPLQPIALAAQLQLVPFYESFGFAAVAQPFDDFGVMHVEMAMGGRS